MSRIKARLKTILSSILIHSSPGERPSPAECRQSDSSQETLQSNSGKLQKQNWNVDTIVMRLFIAMTNTQIRIKIVVIDSNVTTSNKY